MRSSPRTCKNFSGPRRGKRLARSSDQTTVQALDNNPLKFSPTPRTPCASCSAARRAAISMPGATLEAELQGPESPPGEDLRGHAGTRCGSWSRTSIRKRSRSRPARTRASARLSGRARRRLWDTYVARWNAKTAPHEHGLVDAFMLYFAECYDRRRQARSRVPTMRPSDGCPPGASSSADDHRRAAHGDLVRGPDRLDDRVPGPAGGQLVDEHRRRAVDDDAGAVRRSGSGVAQAWMSAPPAAPEISRAHRCRRRPLSPPLPRPSRRRRQAFPPPRSSGLGALAIVASEAALADCIAAAAAAADARQAGKLRRSTRSGCPDRAAGRAERDALQDR